MGSAIAFTVPFLAAWILIFTVGDAVGVDVDTAMDNNAVFFALMLAIAFGMAGLGIGLAQWFHVRRDYPKAGAWIPAMAGGFIVVAVF